MPGFLEQTDTEAGRIIDELDKEDIRKNTLVFYILSDNGASAEGIEGTISELLAQNGIATTVAQQMTALNQMYGGLDSLGGPLMDNMYHAAWAWAGSAPFQGTKLVAGYFGGTRTPLVISWPNGIRPDKTPHPQFHHVNDIVPTIYDLLGIVPPRIVDGFQQDPIDGVSMTYTFDDAKAPDAQAACSTSTTTAAAPFTRTAGLPRTFGPLVPWLPGAPGLANWDSAKDRVGTLRYHQGFLGGRRSGREGSAASGAVAEGIRRASEGEQGLSAGRGHLAAPASRGPHQVALHDIGSSTRPRRACRNSRAPGLGRENTTVTIDAEIGEKASGVLYALGGAGGGLTLYMDKGQLVYEYNMMIIERYIARSARKLAAGQAPHRGHDTTLASKQPLSPADVVLKVDGQEVARTTVKRTVPAAFSASETFDVGVDLGSPVSLDYFDRSPFRFDGIIKSVQVDLK